MTSQIQETLCRLHRTQKTEEVVALIGDLERACQEQLFSETDLGYVTSLLTTDSQSLLSFLQSIIGRDQLNDAKAKSFELLIDWFSKSPAHLQQCALSVKDIAFQAFCRDRSAKVRCLSLMLLSKVLDACQGMAVAQEFAIPALVNRLYLELGQTTSFLKPTVKEEIMCILGLIAQGYPEAVGPYRDKLLSFYISELNVEMTGSTRRSHKNVIAGCLQGLSGFMYHFSVSFEEDPDNCFKIFECVRRAVEPNKNLQRYDIPKAALILLSRHAAQFGRCLLERHRLLYGHLAFWSRHHNRDMKQAGVAALEAFLREVSNALVDCPNEEEALGMFEFFIQEFKKTMTSEGNFRELVVALKGYGMFAVPCKHFLKQSDILYMLADIIRRSENVFRNITNPGVLEDNLPLLMSFQEATASILRCAQEVPPSQLVPLEKLTVLQIQNFPFVPENLGHKYCRSLTCLLLFLQPVAPSSLSRIVYQGVIRTCSHPIVADAEAAEDAARGFSDPRKVTYKRYAFLWNYLLSAMHIKELNQLDVPLKSRHGFVDGVYDCIVSATMELVGKLNLSVRKRMGEGDAEDGSEHLSSDPAKDARAECPNDFNIFINLVDFFKDIVTDKCLGNFKKWAFVLTRRFVELSTKHPLVSGFYKALTACLVVCNKTSYFEESSEEACACLGLVRKFAHEVLALFRQFRDDLLVACLDFLLHLPIPAVRESAKSLVPPFKVALQQGLSYLPLARSALDALKTWEKNLPPDLVEECFRGILPSLDPYLALGVRNDVGESTVGSTAPKRKMSKKIALKVLYTRQEEHKKRQGTQLEAMQLEVLEFLGGLGGNGRRALLADLEARTSKSAVAWDSDTKEHLVFALPFVDVKAEISLDAFLPRVAEIARFAGRRQTKVAGCELLHSLVLYMIGVGAQASEMRRTKFPMDRLYKRLFPELLHLSCDPDQVAKNLFEPLVLQMMHWFSSRSAVGSRESATVVECLWDTLTQPQETALRDFAARCLREFVQWSIKQTSPKEMERNPVNVKAVLKRVYGYCTHPNAYKRMGAALAFNNIYKIIREEEAVVDAFTLEILVHFVNSLKLAHSDEKSLGTQDLCRRVLDIVLRIMTTKSSLLNAPSKRRRWPPDPDKRATLRDAVNWLLRQTSCPQEACRRKCMELVCALIPRLPGVPSNQEYVTSFAEEHSPGSFVEVFEAHVVSTDLSRPTASAIKRFCGQLMGLLECYTWLLEQKLADPTLLFKSAEKPSALFSLLETFLGRLALQKISKVLPSEGDGICACTPAEERAFNYAKCCVMVRLFNFLTALLEDSSDRYVCVPDSVWLSDTFWNCVVFCVLEPTEVGFDLADLEVVDKLPGEMLNFLHQVRTNLPELHRNRFVSAYEAFVANHPDRNPSRLHSLPPAESERDVLSLIGLTAGCRLLAESKLVATNRDVGRSAVDVVVGVVLKDSEPTPLVRELCTQLLELTVVVGVDSFHVLATLLDHYPKVRERLNSELSRYIAVHCDRCVPALLSLVADGSAEKSDVVHCISEASSWLASRKRFKLRYGEAMVTAVLNGWRKLRCCWGDDASQSLTNDAALLLSRLLQLCSETSLPRSGSLDRFVEAFVSMLRKDSATLADKAVAMEMLPVLSNDEQPETSAKLREVLEEVAARHFPLECSDLLPGSAEFLSYTDAVHKLINAVEISGNPTLLDLAVRILYREKDHFMEDEFLHALRRMAERCSEAKQKRLLQATYGLFTENQGLPTHLRLALAQKVLCMMLKRCSKSTLKTFFVDNVSGAVDAVAARLISSSESQIVTKIGMFSCLEEMYRRFGKDDVMGQRSEINAAFCRARGVVGKAVGNELTKEVTRYASIAKKDDARGESKFPELRLGLRCAAYNALTAIIACTQVDANFYDVFLFQEKPEKGELLWNNLVDSNANYSFPLEREAPTKRKRQLVGATEMKEGEADGARGRRPSIRASLLSRSSLAEDATPFTLSLSEQAFFRANTCDVNASIPDVKEKVMEKLKFVDLEDDELNGHPCMAAICSVLTHMADIGIVPKEAKADGSPAPKWLTNVIDSLVGDHVSRNGLLFLCRVLVNSAEVIAPYGHHLIPPLLSVISSKRLGDALDAFVLDVVVTVLVWSSRYTAEELATTCPSAELQPVLDFLVDHCGHERREVLRNNLEVIRWFVQLWKPRLSIPYAGITRHLSRYVPDGKDTSSLHLLGMFLANDLVSFDEGSRANVCKVLAVLPKMLHSKYRVAYTAAAEVVGLALKKMNEASFTDEAFEANVVNKLRDLSLASEDQFALCLHQMCQFYDPMADRFCDKLILMLPLALSKFKEAILEVIALCCVRADDVVRKLISAGFLDFLDHGSHNVQRVSLEICTKLASAIMPAEWDQTLPIVGRLQEHPEPACRKLVYDVCMLVYDRFRLDPKNSSLAEQAKRVLVLGLADAEMPLRLSVGNFWSREEHLPKRTADRLLSLLRQTYLPEAERHFLPSVNFLLLEMTSLSSDYSRKVFPHPLSDCQFVDYSVVGSWRQRHAAMTPLFAETLSVSQTLSMSHTEGSATGRSMAGGELRATAASLQFAPTLDEADKGSFNWMTQSSFKLSAPPESRPSTSTRLFVVGRSGDGERASAASQGPCWAKDIRFLRRRFYKDEEKVREQHMRREVQRKERRKEQEKEQKARREAEVTLYRRYRLGDLPDVEIPHSAIIAPLQALAQEDQQVAQMLLTIVTDSILKEARSRGAATYKELCSQLQEEFGRVLEESTEYSSPVVAFVLEVAFRHASDIRLAADSVAWASVAGNRQNLGVLLLEEMQLQSSEPSERDAKRRRTRVKQECSGATFWIKLAELYKSLGDCDSVRGVFACASDVSPRTGEAFEKEVHGDYFAAEQLYDELYRERRSCEPDEAVFYDDAVLQCCSNLGDWQGLEKLITSRLEDVKIARLDDLWDLGYKQDHYLPFYMKSKTMTSLANGKNDRCFLEAIRAALDDENKKRVLESNFVEELALTYAVERDYNRSRYYAQCLCEQFLQEWSSLGVLNPYVLDESLQSLQKIADLLDYLRCKMHGDSGRVADAVMENWKSRLPSDADSVASWNDILATRCFYVKFLSDGTDCSVHERARLLDCCARAAIRRNTVAVALRCVADVEKLRREVGEDCVDKTYVHTYCATIQRSCEALPLERKLASHVKMLKKLECAADDSDHKFGAENSALEGRLLSDLSDLLDEGSNKGPLPNLEQLTEQLGLPRSCRTSPRSAARELREQSFDKYREAIGRGAASGSAEVESAASMKMAAFCGEVLQQWAEGELDFDGKEECPRVMVDSVLRSMALGSGEAMDAFPQLLDVVQDHKSCREVFAAACSKVPCWMFLRWLNQILPVLDGETGPFLFDIVEAVAVHYPNALVYPFRISYEGYAFKSSPGVDSECRDFVERIKSRMDRIPLVHDFITALRMLHFPDIAFKEWCQSVEEILKERKSQQTLKRAYRDMLTQVCGEGRTDVGGVHRHFTKAVKKKLVDAFGSDGEKLANMSPKEFSAKCRSVLEGYKADVPTSLKDVSPWLAHFSALQHDDGLEIPGQYSGKHKPMPEYHVKISSFDENILVLSSKQKPCRITIRGDDEREYRFLVKTGEDLRQDDRIERLFEVMNGAFAADPVCRAKRLRLATYKVVPLTTRVGLIEWLSNTVVLRDFVQKGMDDAQIRTLNQLPARSGLASPLQYLQAYDRLKPAQVKSNFQKNVTAIDGRALYKAFLNLSSCSEAFFTLRSRFVVSHAAICVAHWVLGIGDRHLKNFLVNVETGEEVGIDFGYAFGVATQFLPIPELMPFRLTPQYLNLTEPLCQHGNLSCSMQHALRALRNNRQTLLSVLDVFVKEPTVDWMRYTKMQRAQTEKSSSGAEDDGSEKWYPRQKVRIVREKLRGRHPSYICRDELRLRRQQVPNMEIVCLGTWDKGNRRGQVPESQELSVEEQVQCLVEQAGDPVVLGLTWMGWEPWV